MRMIATTTKMSTSVKKGPADTTEAGPRSSTTTRRGLISRMRSAVDQLEPQRRRPPWFDRPKAIVLVKSAYQIDPKFYTAAAAMTLGLPNRRRERDGRRFRGAKKYSTGASAYGRTA